MIVVSPFARLQLDLAEQLEQRMYCFGGDGDSGSGGGSQAADMDREMADIEAEFDAMDRAYESGQSFTSKGVTTDSSDARDSSQDVRYDPVTDKTYNFNINRAADYYVDESGRRVYDTLDPAMQDLYEASEQFDRLQSMYDTGTATVLTESGEIISNAEDTQRKFDLAENQFNALDAAYEKYPDSQILVRENQDLLVTDPSMWDNFITKAGAAFANTVLGQLTGGIGGQLGFAISEGPIGANVGYYGGKALGSGSLFGMGGTIQANAWENPLTGENVTEQIFNNPITGEQTRTFTTAEEFAQRQAEEERLKELYDSGAVEGNPEAFAEARTGTRSPSWRDYVAGGGRGDFFDDFFQNLTGAGALDTLSEPVRDSIVLAKSLSDGGDPLTALVGTFGDDVDEILGLSDKASQALDAVFDEDTAQWLKDNRDLAQIGADIVVLGKDPLQSVTDVAGERILDYLGADSVNERALGRSGLNVANNLNQGMDVGEAVGRGVVDYFKEGGTVDAVLEGTSFTDVLPDFDVDLSFDLPSLPIDWKATWDDLGRTANELLPAFDYDFSLLRDKGFNLTDFNWGEIDLSTFKPVDFGLDVGEWGEFEEAGINLSELDLSDYNLSELADLNLDLNLPNLDLALQKLGQPASQVASLDMDSDLTGDSIDFVIEEDSDIPLSRRLLETV